MQSLYIHLGFMPEEISAKLKPDLLNLKNDEKGLLIITRDDISQFELFEQPFSCYEGLYSAINNNQYAEIFPKEKNNDIKGSICSGLKKTLEESLKFEVKEHRIEDAKSKLADGCPSLSIINIGNTEKITDVYLQFPEMGFQSNLVIELVKKIFDGLFDFLENSFKNNLYTKVVLDAFGAGGSLQEINKPGTKSIITGALSIRRFLNKQNPTNLTSRSSISFFEDNKILVHFDAENENSILTQEGARFYYIQLANHKLKKLNEKVIEIDLSVPYLSAPYLSVLKDKNNEYRQVCESIVKLNAEILILNNELSVLLSTKKISLDDVLHADSSFIDAYNVLNQKKYDIMDSLNNTEIAEKKQHYENRILGLNKELENISEAKKSHEIINNLKEKLDKKTIELDIQEERKKQIINIEINKVKDFVEKSLSDKAKKMECIISEISNNIEKHKNNSISCSASFFLDETMKYASNILLGDKAANANMEDDLVINLVSYAKNKINQLNKDISVVFNCSRVNCDPFKINEEFSNSFKNWAKNARYELDNYVNAILWKNTGFRKKFISPDAHWPLADSTGVSNSNLFFKVEKGDKQTVLDPFWREIATDLLADIDKGDAFIDSLSETEKNTMKEDARKIKLKLNKNGINENNLKDTESEIKIFIKNFLNKNNFFDNDSNKYKIWIRKKSWGGNKEQMLDELTMNSANIDRALYVSTNIIALKKHGKKLINEIHNEKLRAVSQGNEKDEGRNGLKR